MIEEFQNIGMLGCSAPGWHQLDALSLGLPTLSLAGPADRSRGPVKFRPHPTYKNKRGQEWAPERCSPPSARHGETTLFNQEIAAS